MQAGLGVQLGAGNRWGDYSAMTLDPIDQCTFYYTNEYLKTNGGFNWSTRIAAFKFPSCVSAASLWGTVTGTITSSQTSAPISGRDGDFEQRLRGREPTPAASTQSSFRPAATPPTAADANRNCTVGVASFGECRTAGWRHGYPKLHDDRHVEARGERLHD